MNALNTSSTISPRLQRAKKAAEKRGLVATVIIDASVEKNGAAPWLRVTPVDEKAGTSLSVFDGAKPQHFLDVQVASLPPHKLIAKAIAWAEHARVILAAADGKARKTKPHKPSAETSLVVYRGAYVCGTIGCKGDLDRFGNCPEGHRSEKLWVEDAVEVELEVTGSPRYEPGDHSQPGGHVVEDVEGWFDGREFKLTDAEDAAASQDIIDHGDDGAFGPQYDS